jgi:hypothetical protein
MNEAIAIVFVIVAACGVLALSLLVVQTLGGALGTIAALVVFCGGSAFVLNGISSILDRE